MFSFLLYYIRLRAAVLLGRHNTSRPLCLRYRWRQWQYTQHLKWLKERGWMGEGAAGAAPELRPKAKGEEQAAVKRAA